MQKPRINPHPLQIDYILEALAAICLLYAIVQIIVVYPSLPQKIPVNFDVQGMPNEWGPKSTILLFPLVALFIYSSLTLLNRYPHMFNYPVPITEANAPKQYQLAKSLVSALKFSVTGIFLYIQLHTTSVAKQISTGMDTSFTFIAVLGTLLPVIIYFILSAKWK